MTTDSEFIDWLEKHQALVNFSQDGPHVCAGPFSKEYQHFYGNSYREAIEAAIKGCKEMPEDFDAEFERLSLVKRRTDLAYEAALLVRILNVPRSG